METSLKRSNNTNWSWSSSPHELRVLLGFHYELHTAFISTVVVFRGSSLHCVVIHVFNSRLYWVVARMYCQGFIIQSLKYPVSLAYILDISTGVCFYNLPYANECIPGTGLFCSSFYNAGRTLLSLNLMTSTVLKAIFIIMQMLSSPQMTPLCFLHVRFKLLQ